MKSIMINFFNFLFIAVTILYGWQMLEFLIMGEITHRSVDDIIGSILIISLYANLKMWRKLKSNKQEVSYGKKM